MDPEFDKQVDSLLWFIENPEALEAMRDETLKQFVLHMKRKLEEAEAKDTAVAFATL